MSSLGRPVCRTKWWPLHVPKLACSIATQGRIVKRHRKSITFHRTDDPARRCDCTPVQPTRTTRRQQRRSDTKTCRGPSLGSRRKPFALLCGAGAAPRTSPGADGGGLTGRLSPALGALSACVSLAVPIFQARFWGGVVVLDLLHKAPMTRWRSPSSAAQT